MRHSTKNRAALTNLKQSACTIGRRLDKASDQGAADEMEALAGQAGILTAIVAVVGLFILALPAFPSDSKKGAK